MASDQRVRSCGPGPERGIWPVTEKPQLCAGPAARLYFLEGLRTYLSAVSTTNSRISR